MQRVEILRLARERLTVDCFGIVHLPALMMRGGAPQRVGNGRRLGGGFRSGQRSALRKSSAEDRRPRPTPLGFSKPKRTVGDAGMLERFCVLLLCAIATPALAADYPMR